MPTRSSDWNPQLYLTYGGERTQAAIDLISRIKLPDPARIIDVGCGPGNSTQALAARWPESRITGLDNSPAMIAQAKADFPAGARLPVEWVLGDAARFESAEKFDLVFSCATIQWIPDHAALLRRWLTLVAPHGALAVQMPLFNQMPMSLAIGRAAARAPWQKTMAGAGDVFTYRDRGFYYDELAERARSVELWETSYIHIMESQTALVEWIRATGLRPYLDRLADEKDRQAFEEDLLQELRADYPPRKNGKVLFPFKRLFFIASS